MQVAVAASHQDGKPGGSFAIGAITTAATTAAAAVASGTKIRWRNIHLASSG